MASKYYCLIAGLVELTLEADRKGFDAIALRNEIVQELSPTDKKHVKMLYTFYDIENVINVIKGREAFNALGNLSREEIEDEVQNPTRLPSSISQVIRAYNSRETEKDDIEQDKDKSRPIENALWEAFYSECAKSKNNFIRQWFDFDRTLRNIFAAYTARSNSLPIAEQLVGKDDITETLLRSSAADFGLKNEVEYIEQVIALLDMDNIIEKESRIDQIRWNKAEELTTFNYFDVNVILAYLIKVNIIHRWVALSPANGKEMFHILISKLVDKNAIDEAESKELEKI